MSKPDIKEVWAQAYDRLRSLESSHRLRHDFQSSAPEPDTGVYREIDGQKLLNFASNDYLDLASHPAVKQGAIDAVKEHGSGSMASRLVCGTLSVHHQLEAAIAKFKGTESALVFSSGYLACMGVVQALSRRADDSLVPIYFDRLAHASLVDGAKQERRNWRTFPHNNVESMKLLLEETEVKEWPSAVIVTEGIFSMDGNVPQLGVMAELCREHNAVLLVDEAHATGTVGPNGAGSVAAAGLTDHPHVVQVGTLSKALGTQGGYVAGPKVLRDLLINTCRSFIFDTALAPACCGAALAAINIINKEPERIQKLHENVGQFRSLLNRKDSGLQAQSPIIPVIIGEDQRAMEASASLREKGFLVPAVRPPTVPSGTSRLRITITSAHTSDDIHSLARTVGQLRLS